MHLNNELALDLAAWGTAEADLPAIGPLRKSLPTWAPKDIPGHFLKHADEQTVVAVAALDRAIQSLGHAPDRFARWSIIAAPQCIGRIAGASSLDRFAKGGAPTISPHLIPQHSLHSVSGALSILLRSRQPNCGVGGNDQSLSEALLAALTPPGRQPSGVWLLATAWAPEPVLDPLGNCTNAPRCYALALALERSASSMSRGSIRLASRHDLIRTPGAALTQPDLPALCQALAATTVGVSTFHWQLSWGPTITLEARPAGQRLAAA